MMAELRRLWLEPEEAEEVRLEAVLHLPPGDAKGGVAVCHPHPQYGGDMNNYVVTALCDAVVRAGYAALRFNFRGTGGSEGSYEGGSGELIDLQAAIRHLARLDRVASVAACGYSFGAMVANRAEDVAAIACVSPANAMVATSVPLLIVIGDEDQFMPVETLTEFSDRSERTTLRVFAGSDHFWGRGLEEASETVASFLGEQLQLAAPRGAVRP